LRFSSANRGFPAGNPLANALVIIVGTLAIAASVVLGFFAFVVLGSVLMILAAIIGIRLWWFNRKMRKAPGFQDAVRRSSGGAHEAIEGEYHVVIDERDERTR
jgi:hypothetical protein